MIVRSFILLLVAFTLAACTQTNHRGSLSKYEKSVEFVENIITDSFIKKGLQEALAEYKEENTTASQPLSDKALDEINILLTREMLNKRVRLISKIAILITAEFTDDEIITLHSMKDFNALKTAQQKIISNPGDHNLFSKLTQTEIEAITDIKNAKNLTL
ncbi:hypothetical protein [Kiloniella antarctica]|uniref:DUF4142 domain-containing protein n=1 Tax=Kiloniella antarctica TaxID=1550907 RepID=A0ABW5BS71_9PROT